MTMKSFFQKILLIIFLLPFFKPVYAQQSRVDSIIFALEKSKVSKGVDSARFDAAIKLIESSTLTDSSIAVIEKAGNQFTVGNDEYWSYRVKYGILNSLIATDKAKAISYGKYNFEAAKKSKTPNASFISTEFLRQIRLPYRNSDMLNEGFEYFNQKLKEYKLNNDSAGLANCYYVLAGFYRTIGLLDQAIYHMKKSDSYIGFAGQNDNAPNPFFNPLGKKAWLNNNGVIGIYYLQKGEYTESLKYSNITFIENKIGNTLTVGNTPTNIAYAKILADRMDSVSYFLDLAINDKENKKQKDYIPFALQIKALYKIKTGNLGEAEILLNQCMKLIEENKIPANASAGTIAPDYYMALIRIKQNRLNEAIELLIKDIERLKNFRLDILRDYKMLAELYEKTGDNAKAKNSYKTFISLQDSLQTDQNKYRSLSFETEQEMNEKELSITKLQSENKISSLTKNFSLGIVALLLLLAGVVYYRFKAKQKANKVLEDTLGNLKSTQTQLIQSEKMASLGELTAGIAHEIQNPLNFVNNFSEVNGELISELVDEVNKGNTEEVKAIANYIKDNSEKINHHGKRADAIVKGMLQHSRSSSATKEPTDINKLADEYLRLAYHGLRAKDKSFNATMKTDYDESIGNINIIPQDIGRVILNLITNAFYTVAEKKALGQAQGDNYEATVSVATKKSNGTIEISVTDNGNGIPQNVIDKIFQPFFTTKPTGQGTGLGLSMSYDIVKAHGGELKVETKEGTNSTFIIQLPIN